MISDFTFFIYIAAGLWLPVWKSRMDDLGATVPYVKKILKKIPRTFSHLTTDIVPLLASDIF